MRARPFILRCIAFFMLLIFAQKSWAGLFLHNELHSNTENKYPGKQEGQGSGLSFNCTCVDDFLMPLDKTAIPVYFQPPLIPTVRAISFKDELLYTLLLFSSLRGPPSCIE